MKKNYIDEISIRMLGNGNAWDYDLISILREMNDLNEKGRDGRTILMHCCIYNFPASFDFLIQHGANINLQDGKGMSALHMAVLYEEHQFVETLLRSGANVDLVDVFGNNPFFRVKYYDTYMIRLLLNFHCDPYHKNNYGKSAFDILSLHPETACLFNGTGDGFHVQ